MTHPHLINYVREQMKVGYTPEEIRSFLIGHGYPVKDIDEAIEHGRKVPTKPLPPVPEKKVVPAATRLFEESFVEIFKTWFFTLFLPTHVFAFEKERATLSRAFMNVLISSSLGGVIVGIIVAIKLLVASPATPIEGSGGFFGLAKLATVEHVTMSPLAAIFTWIAITAFFYLFGLLIGGSGPFERFAYFTSLIAAPLSFILLILKEVLPTCVNFFVLIVFGAVGLYAMLYAVKETHETNLGKAALGTLIPVLIILILIMPALLRFSSIFQTICGVSTGGITS